MSITGFIAEAPTEGLKRPAQYLKYVKKQKRMAGMFLIIKFLIRADSLNVCVVTIAAVGILGSFVCLPKNFFVVLAWKKRVTQHNLTKTLQALVQQHGLSSILHSLAEIQDIPEQNTLSKRQKISRKTERKLSAIDYVDKMVMAQDKVDIMRYGAECFEEKNFLLTPRMSMNFAAFTMLNSADQPHGQALSHGYSHFLQAWMLQK